MKIKWKQDREVNVTKETKKAWGWFLLFLGMSMLYGLITGLAIETRLTQSILWGFVGLVFLLSLSIMAFNDYTSWKTLNLTMKYKEKK